MISTGLVEPGLFFRPRRLALISSPLTRSSDWCGNATSCRPLSSLAQNTMILYDLSSLHRWRIGWSLNLSGMVTVFLCCAITGESNMSDWSSYDEYRRKRLLAFTSTQATHGTFDTVERARFEREAIHGGPIGGWDSVCRDLPIRSLARIAGGAVGRS